MKAIQMTTVKENIIVSEINGAKMIVWHVCSSKKLKKYESAGKIFSPVRAWENIGQAERMSLSTGRKVILRLKFPDDAKKLEGHFNQARVIYSNLDFKCF